MLTKRAQNAPWFPFRVFQLVVIAIVFKCNFCTDSHGVNISREFWIDEYPLLCPKGGEKQILSRTVLKNRLFDISEKFDNVI